MSIEATFEIDTDKYVVMYKSEEDEGYDQAAQSDSYPIDDVFEELDR